MVNKQLFEQSDIEKAKELLLLLDKTELKPTSFFWFYIPHSDSWRLVIASKYFDNKSLKEIYEYFVNKFRNNEAIKQIGLENISLLESDNGLIKLLKVGIITPTDAIAGIRFKSNTINNTFIEDSYIYRLS